MRLGMAAKRSMKLVSVRCHRGGAYSVMNRAAHTARGSATAMAMTATTMVPTSRPSTPRVGSPFAVFHTARVKKPMPWLWNARRLRSRRK